jgi:hypothetical protein
MGAFKQMRETGAPPVGVPGKELLPLASAIKAEDLRVMTQAIEETARKWI